MDDMLLEQIQNLNSRLTEPRYVYTANEAYEYAARINQQQRSAETKTKTTQTESIQKRSERSQAMLDEQGEGVIITKNTMGEVFQCVYCEKVYRARAGLNRHKRTAHVTTKYPCGMCGSMFVRECDLTRHLKDRNLYGHCRKGAWEQFVPTCKV